MIRNRTLIVFVMLLLVVGVASFLLGRSGAWRTHSVQDYAGSGATPLREGPWGKLAYVPIEIAAPAELLPVRKFEESQVKWFFGNFTENDLLEFLKPLGLSKTQWQEVMDARRMRVLTNGVLIAPSHELVFSLSQKARFEIYRRLMRSAENDKQRTIFRESDLDKFHAEYGVSRQTVSLFKRLSCSYRGYLICYCLPEVLQAIPGYDEKANLLQLLSRFRTMLLRMGITADSDVNALAVYWGKACWSTDVRAILKSLSKLPQIIWLDLIELLPPFPTSLLYTFPVPQNELNGPAVNRDCHWTSFNFFRDPPDPNYSNPAYVGEKLKADFFPIQSDPRFGDVVLFVSPGVGAIHSAVFLADNIVYTKNGGGLYDPWLLSTIQDLVDLYSFPLPEGQKLEIQYYRNKYY